MEYDERTIGALLIKWQDILKLRDWDITIKIVRDEWRKRGDIKIEQCNKMAVLMVNQITSASHLEELVIHELIHLKLYGLDQMLEDLLAALYGSDEEDPKKCFAYTQFMEILETTVQDLTKGLLATTGGKPALSLKTLNEVVDLELNKN